MHLFEHGDFAVLVARTAEHFGVAEAWVEKDYYLTEALRIVARELPAQAILKGGTSLSKAWRLTDRISEDMDLAIDRGKFDPPLKGARVRGELEALSAAVGRWPGLSRGEGNERAGGKAREDQVAYHTIFSGRTIAVAPIVLLEAGVRSGNWPTQSCAIASFVGEYVVEIGKADLSPDASAFQMRTLHYRRTFLEKLFAIHGVVQAVLEGRAELGRHARHYADLHEIADRAELIELLGTGEWVAMWDDQDQVSRDNFPTTYVPPPKSFADSPALFPAEALRQQLGAAYTREVAPLYYRGAPPTFDQVLARFEAIRARI